MHSGRIFILLCLSGIYGISGVSYTNEFAVRIKGGKFRADRIAAQLGCTNHGEILKDYYKFTHRRIRKRSTDPHHAMSRRLDSHDSVDWWEQQKVLSRKKRRLWSIPAPPPENGPLYPSLPNDALFNDKRWNQMWYLKRGGRLDMNVIKAWEEGATGKGIHVTILDDGVERSHPDLLKNYDPLSSYDVNDNDNDPTPSYDILDSNRHGTRCAGEVAATANNSFCGVGVAYDAGIGGLRMLDGDVTDAVEAHSLQYHNQHIDIYSASWGPDDDGMTVDGPGSLARKAFIQGIKEGRGGRGSIFVWASGNGGRHHDNCNCDGYTNSIWTLSVSSASENGLSPWYSEACSSSLASTYSSGSAGERKIVTTDLHHGCTSAHTGTSASAPLAAGIIALILEANPNLTWRDVQHITLRCAHKANLRAKDWSTNGVGRNFSHSFGYGIMDSHCMVMLAKKWINVHEQIEASISGDRRLDVHIRGKNRAVSTMEVTDAHGIKYLEHVQAHVTIAAPQRGNVIIHLISPSGTRSNLLAKRPKDYSPMGFSDWPFLTIHMWEESPIGTWKLEVYNDGRSGIDLRRWSLTFHGTSEHPQPEKIPPPNAPSSSPSPPPPVSEKEDFLTSDVYLKNCAEANPQITLGWCSTCEEGYFLHNGRCEATCPESYFPGLSNMKQACIPCYYSCKTCSGPNEYECTSCYGDSKFMKESNNQKYCVNKSMMNLIFSSSKWYYVLSIGLVLNLLIVIFLIIYIVHCSDNHGSRMIGITKYSPFKLTESLGLPKKTSKMKKTGGSINKSLSSVPFRDYDFSSDEEIIYTKSYSDDMNNK